MRACRACGKPLVQRAKEKPGRFAARESCSQSCAMITPCKECGERKPKVDSGGRKHLTGLCEECYRPKVGRGGPKPLDHKARIRRMVQVTVSGCWEWQGAKNKGYGFMMTGSMVDGSRGPRMAQIVSYEAWRGPVPKGMDTHHKCRNKGCVNPKHLELMDHAEHGALDH